MCVIIYKPAGVDKPSLDILNKARIFNPHGCGLCTPDKLYKGLSYSEFLKTYNKVSPLEPLLIHFRYATTGSVKKTNCHPFYDDNLDIQFMHNGVLNYWPSNDMTDSEFAFRHILLPNIYKYGLESKEVEIIINQVIRSSKFAFMQGDNVKLYGDWIESKGLYFSNQRFL